MSLDCRPFVSATQQYDHVTVPAKVNSVARAKVDMAFGNALTNRPAVAHVTDGQAFRSRWPRQVSCLQEGAIPHMAANWDVSVGVSSLLVQRKSVAHSGSTASEQPRNVGEGKRDVGRAAVVALP